MKLALILIIPLIIMKSSEVDLGATHYDYPQGIGRIIKNYHYTHFSINTTTLRQTYYRILTSYTILSSRNELRDSNLLKQASILCDEIYHNIEQVAPKNKRVKRGLINGLGTVIKYIFGNPDANDLEKINNYLNLLEQQRQKDIVTFNNTITIINKISKNINNNTDIINRNLQNISTTLGQQSKQLNLFEAVITLIIQERHFLSLLDKIKRSFIFLEQTFSVEVLSYERMIDMRVHLLKMYS